MLAAGVDYCYTIMCTKQHPPVIESDGTIVRIDVIEHGGTYLEIRRLHRLDINKRHSLISTCPDISIVIFGQGMDIVARQSMFRR